MRRLPIFFLLDVSESMLGENLIQLEDGLSRIISELRTDPHALETAWISVIAFAGRVRKLMPLTELTSVVAPKLPVGGGTSLGRALNYLMDEIDASVRRTTESAKGDWKPIIFLITDGKQTDEVEPAIRRWNERYVRHVTLVAISIGRGSDPTVLHRLTDQDKVLVFEDKSEGGFRQFIAWVTQSVQARSRSVGDPAKEDKLADLGQSVLKKFNLDKPLDRFDQSNAYFVSKCQKTKLPYVSRWSPGAPSAGSGHGRDALMYQLTGCYPVNNVYFEMSAEQPNVATVDSAQLQGALGCPHCGNPVGFGICRCGNTFCMNGEGEHRCPWCEQTSMFQSMQSDDPGFDLTRARG